MSEKNILSTFFLLLTITLTFVVPVGSVHAAIALPEGRTFDQAHDTGYIDWSGPVQYTYFRHRDGTYLPPEEGGASCGSGCWEWVTTISEGGRVSGSFLRDVTYFEVMLAFENRGDGVGVATITACSATRMVDLRVSSTGTPGFLSLDLTVPTGCRNWSITTSGGYARFRSVDAEYVAAPPTSTPTNTFAPTATLTRTAVPTSTFTATATTTSTDVPNSTFTATATATSTGIPTNTFTATSTTTATAVATGTGISTSTATPTHTIVPTATAVIIREEVVVPAIIINNTNQNEITGSGPGGSSTTDTGSGSFVATTPLPWGSGAALSLNYCGEYNVRVRVYVDYNEDKMMSPSEGVTDLQVFLLDQSYSSLGKTYTQAGQATFCLSPTQYGRTVYIDIPYLQQFASLQVPNDPTNDLEVWFPGAPPDLPLFLP